jgi:hypothetical protein
MTQQYGALTWQASSTAARSRALAVIETLCGEIGCGRPLA